jgi:hypothetical protein
MLWSDVREYGEVQLWLPVDATIDITIGTKQTLSPVGRRAAVEALEAELVGFGTYVAQMLLGTRTLMESALTPIGKEPLIPWLPMIQSAPKPISIDCRVGQLDVDVSRTLTDQLVEGGRTR